MGEARSMGRVLVHLRVEKYGKILDAWENVEVWGGSTSIGRVLVHGRVWKYGEGLWVHLRD